MSSKNYIIRGGNTFNVGPSQTSIQQRKAAEARAKALALKNSTLKGKKDPEAVLKEGEFRNLPNDPSGRTKEFMSVDDTCPICHTNRFLNPKLRLLVSNKCFHKMCESCISRLYTAGGESCPTNGCNQILRKTNFTPVTFEDLKVERDVDARKRVAKTFNKRQEDFATLREYNDYLELVEEITFNLIHGISVKDTEERIKRYDRENKTLISENFLKEEREREAEMKREEEELLARQDRQRRAAEEAEEEERSKALAKQTVLQELELTNKSTSKIISKSRTTLLKKSSLRSSTSIPAASHSKFSHLFKSDNIDFEAQSEEVNEDPFKDTARDNWYAYEDLFEMPDSGVIDPWTDEYLHSKKDVALGYCRRELWERPLRSAVAALWLPPLSHNGDVHMS